MDRSVAEGIYRIDVNGLCTDANEACAKLLGFSSREQLLGKNMHQLIHHHHSDGSPYAECDCRVSLATRENKPSHVDDEVFWRQDGSFFPVEYWSRPESVDGQLVGCVINFIDISDRVIAERKFARSEQRLRFAMETSNVCLWEWNMVTDQVLWSPQLYALLGYDSNTFQPTRTNFLEMVHAEDRQGIIEMISQAYEGTCTNLQHEFRVKHGTGKYIWVHCRGHIERDPDGTAKYLTSMAIDVTDSHRANDELAEARQRLELGVSLAGLTICDIDYANDTVQLTQDAALMFGIGDVAMSINRTRLHQTFHPDDFENIMDKVKNFVDGTNGEVFDCKHRIVLPDGGIRWLHVCKRRCHFGAKVNSQRAILAVRDVTFEMEARDRIEQSAEEATAASSAKSLFLANMSHEIRTPMTAILGYTELLLSDSSISEQQYEQLEIVHRNGTHLLSVINDVLDLSKIESGKLDVFQERVEPLKVVEDIRSIMEVRANEREIGLEVVYAGSLPKSIKSDGKRLKQILFNLVGNAIKFTPEGKVTIRVSANVQKPRARNSESENEIVFEVVDTGIGMSDDLLLELFEPFAQGHKDIGRNYGGTGLGLAISRRLARLLGGDIEVESELGAGSIFRLVLPIGIANVTTIATPPTAREQLQQIVESATSPLMNCNVLVVDDRRDIRLLTTTVLHKKGATTEQAEDGEKAVERVQRALQNDRPYDLIVLDMQMPKLDGYRTAKQLRTMGYEGPILALTAEAMQGDSQRCLEAGCNQYLSKPVNIPLFTQIALELIQAFRLETDSQSVVNVPPRHGY